MKLALAYLRILLLSLLVLVWFFVTPTSNKIVASTNYDNDLLAININYELQEMQVLWPGLKRYLVALYTSQDYHSFWLRNGELKLNSLPLIHWLSASSSLGLVPSSFPLDQINDHVALRCCHTSTYLEQKARLDIILSASLIIYLTQVKYGTLETNKIWTELGLDARKQDVIQTFKALNGNSSASEVLAGFKPSSFRYRNLELIIQQRYELVSRLTDVLSDNSEGNGVLSSIHVVQILQLIGFDKPSTEDVPYNEDELKGLIISYLHHKGYRGSVIDNRVLAWHLLRDYLPTFHQLRLNFDRIKQYPFKKADYLFTNIPSFQMVVYEGENPAQSYNVVVGSKSTPTPVLSGPMLSVITFPQWTIPASITVNEIAPAMLRDSNYLDARGYYLIDWQGYYVDPYEVAWDSLQVDQLKFKVVQDPGKYNALGTIKFNFFNTQSIYMHDTNAKSYFKQDYRAVSHGCIRLDDPRKLAHYLLDESKYEQFEDQFKYESTKNFVIQKEVDVYIRYFTCDVGVDGKLLYYKDVYDRDKADYDAIYQAIPSW